MGYIRYDGVTGFAAAAQPSVGKPTRHVSMWASEVGQMFSQMRWKKTINGAVPMQSIWP